MQLPPGGNTSIIGQRHAVSMSVLPSIAGPDPVKAAVYLIGLRQATGRAELMQRELDQAGLSAVRIDAVDSTQVSRAEMLKQCSPEGNWGYFQTKDMACTLSHAKAWGAFLASDADVALILEDDVFLSPDTGAWLSDLCWWPADAGIVKFERWRAKKLQVALGKDGVAHLGREVRQMLSRHAGGAAYAISRGAAQPPAGQPAVLHHAGQLAVQL